MIIGISGTAGVGKSTIGKVLEQHGFVRRTFADPLYAGVAKLAGVPVPRTIEEKNRFKHAELLIRFPGGALLTLTGRQWLQFFGTNFARGCHDDIWVALEDRNLGDVFGVRLYYDDVRFPNESEMIRDNCGHLWRINRPGYEPGKNAHESETALHVYPGWDTVLDNNGTIADLERKVRSALEELGCI